VTLNVSTGSGTFNNGGMLVRTTTTGTATIEIPLSNTGTVDVQSGTLRLAGGGSGNGGFDATGATLNFGGGAFDLSGPVSGTALVFSGANPATLSGSYAVTDSTTVTSGTVNITGEVSSVGSTLSVQNGTANFSSGESIGVTTLSIAAGNLTGSDTITVSGMLSWTGGTMSGTGSTIANGGIAISGTPGKVLNGRTLTNNGMATWSGGTLTAQGSAVINNPVTSSFDIRGDVTLNVSTGSGTFNNGGMLVRTTTTGTATIEIPLSNTGTVDVQSGTLRFTSTYTQTAGVTQLNGGSIATTTNLTIQGGVLRGTGTITGNVANTGGQVAPGLSPGTLSITGTYAQGATGTYAVEIGGTTAGSQFDVLAITGAATLNGTLAVSLINSFTPNLGDTFQIMTFASQTGAFPNGVGLNLGDGLGFNTNINPNNVTLQYAQEICNDGADNDGNGLTDCRDPKCADVPACGFTQTPTATVTPTSTRTVTSTSTPQPTQTATSTSTGAPGTATPTTPPTATSTPTPARDCVGDCQGDRVVTVDELITGVNIALGLVPLSICPVFDFNGDTLVTVDELITAVRQALEGCPTPGVSPAPTTPPTGVTPTPTTGDGNIEDPVSAAVSVIANAMGAVPSVVAAIVTGIEEGGAAASLLVPRGAGNCPLGGTATRTGSFPVNVQITLSECRAPTTDGTVTFNGTASIQLASFNATIDITFADTNGATTLVANALLVGTVSPTLGEPCFLTAANLTVSNGTLIAGTPLGQQAGVAFQGTQIRIDNISFSAACVPEIYRLTFNGQAGLLSAVGDPISVTFSNLVMNVDERTIPTLINLQGGMSSDCFGGAVTLSTDPPLRVPSGALCPTSGTITIMGTPETTQIVYPLPDCLDPRLFMCVL
jgi:hypothetical protein